MAKRKKKEEKEKNKKKFLKKKKQLLDKKKEAKKTLERKCKNCRLFNSHDSVCMVNILHKGQTMELTVKPEDDCHWERVNKEVEDLLQLEIRNAKETFFKERLEEELDIPIEIKQIRMWSDGKDGFIET